jgi:hypothetical protein
MMNDTACTVEMPKYKSNKEFWALKIKSISPNADESATINSVEKNYAPFKVDASYLEKHKPYVGGYYVVYQDGYKSFSPAKALEEGSERI